MPNTAGGAGCVWPGEGRGYLVVFYYLRGSYREKRDRIFAEVHNDSKRGNRHKLWMLRE